MKVNMIKHAGGTFTPADEGAEEKLKKLKNCDFYEVNVKLNHNYKLLQKIHVFFKFCCQNYYGDENVTEDQIILVKNKLLIFAGYYKQVFLRDGVRFELVPKSISYASMTPEERDKCYNQLVNAALKHVFNTYDENTFNKLMSFF